METSGMPSARFWRDFSQRLVFHMHRVEMDDYPTICKELVSAFALTPESGMVLGFDVVFQDYRSGNFVVGLEWDIWMGFIVVAKSQAAEPLVGAIGEYLLKSKWASPSVLAK